MPLASASMTNRTEEVGFSLMNSDSANHDGVAGDCHHNDTTIPLPVTSVSPFPHWNMNETSHCYGKEPAGVNSMTDSSQFKSAQNFQMDHQGEERRHLPFRPDSSFPCSEGYIGQPYQYARPDNLTIPGDVMNAAFNPNSFEKPHSGGMCLTPSDSFAGRPQMINSTGLAMIGNIGQPYLNTNFGLPLFNANQGGAEPLLTPGKLNERFMAVGSGSSREFKSNTNIPRINVTGNSERAFLPPIPINTYHNQLGSRSFLNPGLEVNGVFPGFQNFSEVVSDLTHTGNHEVLFDSRPGLHLGPSYTSQRPAAGDQNYHLRQVNRDLGLGGGKNIGMEFKDVGHRIGFERCMALPSLPFVGSQTLPCDNGQSRVNGQLIPSSIGMVTDQSPSGILPEDNGKFSSQSFASPPLLVATGSTRGQDPSSNHGQSQVVGSIQQSNSLVGPHSPSDLGIQTGIGNTSAQVSRPYIISSLKRAASHPLSSTVPGQRRKTLPAHPLIHPSTPTWNRLAPSVPNTPQAIPPMIRAAHSLTPQAIPPMFHAAHSLTPQAIPPMFRAAHSLTPQAISPMIRAAHALTPQATYSSIPPFFPTTWTQSALSAPNITQRIPPLMQTPPFPTTWTHSALSAPNITQTIPPLMQTPPFLPPHDKRISSLSPSSCTPPLPNQQLIARSLAQQRLRAPVIPSAPNVASVYIKYKDQTPEPEPIGHKCFLCKRDLSYTPEGPIFQPLAPPAAAVLSCGHTFHDQCLERITPDDQSKDPPCIPCALRE